MSRRQPTPPPYKTGGKEGPAIYERPAPPPPPPPPNPRYECGGTFTEYNRAAPPRPEPPKTKYIKDHGDKNMTKKPILLLTILILLIVTACWAAFTYHKNTTPDCFSELSKSAVQDLSRQLLVANSGEMANQFSYKVRDVRAQSENMQTGALLCAATLDITTNKQSVSAPILFTIEKMEQYGKFYYTVSVQ